MENFSYKIALQEKMFKDTTIKVFSTLNGKYDNLFGLECDEFDNVIENDIKNFSENLISSRDNTATRNAENLRRLKLLKIAKQISLNRNNYFALNRVYNKDFFYTSKNPKYLELFELNKLLSNAEYLRYLLKSKLVNDIRNSVFKKIADNLYIDHKILDVVKYNTREPNTATSSSNAILSNNGSHHQERVKDTRLKNNRNLEKYQHNTKWVIFSNNTTDINKTTDINSAIYQLPKMNGKYHTEFCLRYFIPNIIFEDKISENSLYTMIDLLNILLNIREHYNEYFLKVLKDNIINVFEGLSFDMQCILSPSLDNVKNSDRTRGIRKIVNLPISRIEKINMLLEFKYLNKFKESVYPFHSSNKYKIIINSSYHFVKDTSLTPTDNNPNCLAKGFLDKFKLSFGIYKVSNNFVLHEKFITIKKNNKFDLIGHKMYEILKTNYYNNDFGDAIRLIDSIRNENDINVWNNTTPITVWLHEFLTFSDFSMRLYNKLFPKSIDILKNCIDNYDHILRQIVTDEICARTNLVRNFLTKSNRKSLNKIMYTGHIHSDDFKQQIIKLYIQLNDNSCKRLLKYIQCYMKIIANLDDVVGHMLFNHIIKRYSYFIDTKCYFDPAMNARFFKSSKNYAFPMFTKAFSNILKKKRSKISDELYIYNYAIKPEESIKCDLNTDDLGISEDLTDEMIIEYFSDDESFVV